MLSSEASEVLFIYPTVDKKQYPPQEEEFEDTIGLIRIRKSKDRQHNGQKKKNKRTNIDLQNIAHKTKHRVAGILL
jgi:hypothetical protein